MACLTYNAIFTLEFVQKRHKFNPRAESEIRLVFSYDKSLRNGGIIMDILLVMCIGVLVGKFLIPGKAKTANEYLSLLCTFLLIFSMGVTLGSDDNFFEELSALGVTSFLFFLIPTALSILLVYLLTRHFMQKKDTDAQRRSEKK